MKLKSYQTNSVEAAIRLAKVELGDDAIFMGSRENGPGDESSARYEVTFAVAVGDGRTQGGAAAGTPGSGAPRLSRPGWAGAARRAFGRSREERTAGSAREADLGEARLSPPAAAQKHWQDFLPEGMTAPRTPQPAAGTAAAGTAPGAVLTGDDPPSRIAVSTLRAPGPEANHRLFAAIERLSHEAGRLRNQLDEERREVPPATREGPKDVVELARSNGIELLVSQGMCVSAARKLVGEALSACPRPLPAHSLQKQLKVSIERGCRVDATVGRAASPSEPAIAAFVGPAGAGKTSAICKLAVRIAAEADRPLRLLSLDPYRLGASEQLASLADLLNAPFALVEDCGEAGAAIRQAIAPAADAMPPLILIDTPGYGPAEWKQARALADAFAGLPNLDTHMVVAATSSEGHLRRTLDAFRIFRPRKLLITKLDECAEAGAIVGETLRRRLPISYFSAGQRIPEDIAAATPGRLAQQLLQAF